ncbi:hypothetical protein D5086_027253 [Populus alba]|uniref:Uncharacterized protein n=1 Tax=Populus alba TaxID=43335 RepID=A0ACC4AVI4_POPAL
MQLSCNEGEGPLFLIGLQVIDPEDLSRVVGDCVYSKGQWNHSRFVHMLPVQIITKIASIRRPPLELGGDSFFLAFRSFRRGGTMEFPMRFWRGSDPWVAIQIPVKKILKLFEMVTETMNTKPEMMEEQESKTRDATSSLWPWKDLVGVKKTEKGLAWPWKRTLYHRESEEKYPGMDRRGKPRQITEASEELDAIAWIGIGSGYGAKPRQV